MGLQIPVRNDQPAYGFQVELESSVYFLDFRYNTRQGRWIMDILSQTQEPILLGLPVLTDIPIGTGYTIEAKPPGYFVAVDLTGQGRNADRETFGVDVLLLYEESGS